MLECDTPPTLSLLDLDRPNGGALEETRTCKCVFEREKGEVGVWRESEKEMMLIKMDNKVTEGGKWEIKEVMTETKKQEVTEGIREIQGQMGSRVLGW